MGFKSYYFKSPKCFKIQIIQDTQEYFHLDKINFMNFVMLFCNTIILSFVQGGKLENTIASYQRAILGTTNDL